MFSRIPKFHDGAEPRQGAWELDGDGDLQPTLSNVLLLDEAWEITENRVGLMPREAFTDDDFWEVDGDGNLTPKAA
jgi:hypothetical protein